MSKTSPKSSSKQLPYFFSFLQPKSGELKAPLVCIATPLDLYGGQLSKYSQLKGCVDYKEKVDIHCKNI
jgi:hypothetical protein